MADLGVYQGEYRELVFGEGTEFHVDGEVGGLFVSQMRSGDRPVPRGHGHIRGPDYAEPRVVTIPFTIVGVPHSQTLTDRLNTLRSIFSPTPTEQHWLRWRVTDTTFAVPGRVTRAKLGFSPKQTREGRWRGVVEFRAADPYLYSDDEHQAVVPIFGVGALGGQDLAADLPLDMAASVPLRENIHNAGTAVGYPTIRFGNNGAALTYVDVDNLTTGENLRIETAVPQGDVLVADMYGYTRSLAGPHVHIDGQSRFGDWQQPRVPLGLAPGDNVMEFTTDGVDVTCLFTWRDTWL